MAAGDARLLASVPVRGEAAEDVLQVVNALREVLLPLDLYPEIQETRDGPVFVLISLPAGREGR